MLISRERELSSHLSHTNHSRLKVLGRLLSLCWFPVLHLVAHLWMQAELRLVLHPWLYSYPLVYLTLIFGVAVFVEFLREV